jgi:3-keto-5-aminohexanoate cleavage enzyme
MVGADTTRAQTPYLPITADEIGEEARRCREAGAAMVHIHVREPDGTPSQSPELFAKAIAAIRSRCDVLVQVSTGGAVGMGVDERCGGLTLSGALKPDMATLTTGTVNFGDGLFENPRPLVLDIARRIRACGLRPEVECFDAGMMDEALNVAKAGLLELPAHYDFVLGSPGSLGASPEALRFLVSRVVCDGRRAAPAADGGARRRVGGQRPGGSGGQHLSVQGRLGEGELRAG